MRRVKGWERDWAMVADELDECDVESRLTRTEAGNVQTMMSRMRKKFGVCRTDVSTPVTGNQTWLFMPPEIRSREGSGPWKVQDVGMAAGRRNPLRQGLSELAVLMNTWGAMPVRVTRDPGRRIVLDLQRVKSGRMRWELEVDGSSFVLFHVEAWLSDGRRQYEELRETTLHDGFALPVRRVRREWIPVESVMDEAISWKIGAGVVADADLLP